MPPRRVEVLTVAMDHGQFTLTDGTDGGDYLAVLELAIRGDGIGQGGGRLVVLSPHQNNFAMRLAVEHWDAEPPDDISDWNEVFLASIAVPPTGPENPVPTDPAPA